MRHFITSRTRLSNNDANRHIFWALFRGAHVCPDPDFKPHINHQLCESSELQFTAAMASARVPQKRILGEATNTHRNNVPSSPTSAKKRKLESIASSPAARFKSSQNGPKSKLGSSQPKSQFESEVLEKMTQDIEGLKRNNAEKDQQWARPGLGSFDPETDNLVFQQIEVEEGTLHGGGKATVKLFGVTEVCSSLPLCNSI